jgi:FixJ family two-component response regulator/signal transduction histidine kinase
MTPVDGSAARAAQTEPSRDGGAWIGAEEFEELLAEASLRFACLTWDRAFDAVQDTVEQIRDRFGFDRATYCEFPGSDRIEVVCSTAAPGVSALPTGRVTDTMDWFVRELLANRVIALSDLPRGLPPEAAAEAERCRTQGVRAHLSIPLHVGHRVVAALSFGSLGVPFQCPAEVVRRLSIVGALIATAVDRVRTGHEAHRLQERLRYADRTARTAATATAFAHELTQPIAAILGNAQAGLRYIDADRATPAVREVREVLEAIVRDDRRASETIRAVRRLLSRDEREHEPVDLGDTLREIVALLRPELQQAAVGVETRIVPGVRVLASRLQMQQVAMNLVRNAITAMLTVPASERVLRVEVAHAAHGTARLRVADSGPGVPGERAESLFEPHWTSHADGFGLGLTICRAIVEAHCGDIRLVPRSGRGATFEIDLPELAAEADDRHTPEPSGVRCSPVLASRADAPVVAVVADDEAVRESVARLLSSAGFDVRAWADGRAFLDDPCVKSAGCVLLDLRMPGLRGPDLQLAMRERGHGAPVIYLSDDDDVHEGVEAMKSGAADFLLKPVPADVLIPAVRSAVERDTARRQVSAALAACRSRYERLTARERDVTREVLRGRLNKQIAADLGISEPTVKQHRARVMEKMEVRSVAQLIRACDAILPSAAHPQEAVLARP